MHADSEYATANHAAYLAELFEQHMHEILTTFSLSI